MFFAFFFVVTIFFGFCQGGESLLSACVICRLSSAGFSVPRTLLQVTLDFRVDLLIGSRGARTASGACRGALVTLAPSRVLLCELGRGQKVVRQEAEWSVELPEALQLLVGVHAGVAYGLTHHRVVLLLDEAVVVFAVRRGSRVKVKCSLLCSRARVPR